MNLVTVPGILKKLFPEILWNGPVNRPVLYFTFDDGPTPEITGEVLSILHRYKAQATFFCIGRNVERHPEIYNQIIAAGHSTGNHTYSHLKGWYTKNKDYYADIELASFFIKSNLYRPGYGLITPAQIKHLTSQYQIVLWSLLTCDYDSGIRPEKCLDNVIRHATPGSVIVFHDSLKAATNMLYALPRALEYFEEKGYTFEALPNKF